MKINKSFFYVFAFFMIFLVLFFTFGFSKIVSVKTKVAVSHATTLCYSINSYYEKNGKLPEVSENLLQVVFEKSNGNDPYTKEFFGEGEEIEYNKLSPYKYEFVYKENGFLFKVPKLLCASDQEGKNVSLASACNCSLMEH